MSFTYPFLGVGHRIEPELFDLLKHANCDMRTYTQGIYMEQFESHFKNKFGFEHCLAVSNAVSGLELVADDIGINHGDEVLCPAHTYCASAYPFLKRGATIKWLDINPNTFQVDQEIILDAITPKTKAIIFVHLYGSSLNTSSLYPLLRDQGILLIEDCAQALGASFKGNYVGVCSDYAVFSFQSHKNISTLGEGGMVAVKSSTSYANMVKQRHNGHEAYSIYPQQYWKPAMSNVTKPYQHSYPSNFCLNEFSCLTGSFLLDRLETINERKKANFLTLAECLDSSDTCDVQCFYEGATSTYHLAPIRVKLDPDSVDQVFRVMASKGIQCAKQYMPLYRYELFSPESPACETIRLLPHTDKFYDQMISLPFHDSLSCDDIALISYELLSSVSMV